MVSRSGRPPARPRPRRRRRRTHSGSRAGCAVGRGLGTRLRAAARPRAGPAAPHRPPPAQGPPSPPPSSPELLRRGGLVAQPALPARSLSRSLAKAAAAAAAAPHITRSPASSPGVGSQFGPLGMRGAAGPAPALRWPVGVRGGSAFPSPRLSCTPGGERGELDCKALHSLFVLPSLPRQTHILLLESRGPAQGRVHSGLSQMPLCLWLCSSFYLQCTLYSTISASTHVLPCYFSF